VVTVALNGEMAFGAGPRRCLGRAHALALAGLPRNRLRPGAAAIDP